MILPCIIKTLIFMQKVQLENHWAFYQILKTLYMEKKEILLVIPNL